MPPTDFPKTLEPRTLAISPVGIARIALLMLLAAVLSACSAYKKCGANGCPGDAELSTAIQAEFDKHAALKPPNRIRIQTLNHVVYLTGLVDTELERSIAESIAHDTSGVVRVVNSIGVLGNVY